jgi:polysaccharide pyruvyl transferase WcaK-like protein
MKVFLIRLKNTILNLGSFSAIVFLFFTVKIFTKKRKIEVKKIAWFGAYGNGNLGDDLIFYSLKRLIKNKNFDISLSIRDIEKTKNYGVPIFTKGEQFYDFGKYLNTIKNADAVFLGGGGLLEYYYPSKQAYRMLMIYLCPLMIARVYGKSTFVLGMGVNKGKIDNSLVRFVYKHVLSECTFIVTRDDKSKEGLFENGVKTTIFSSFDPVLSLHLPFTKIFCGLIFMKIRKS